MVQLPAYLQKYAPKAELASDLTQGLGAAMPPMVSRKGGRFTILGANGLPYPNTQPLLTLDAILVGANRHASRIYYENDYQANETAAPDCFSDNGVAPSSQAGKPQNAVCATCPKAEWGSSVSRQTGKGVPACSTEKKIALFIPASASPTVFLLTIPPKSLKPWRNYMAHIGGMGVSPEFVITRFAFDAMDPFLLSFEVLDFVPEKYCDAVVKLRDSEEPGIVCGALDRPIGIAPVQRLGTQITSGPQITSGKADEATGRPNTVRPGPLLPPALVELKQAVDESLAKDAAFVNQSEPAPPRDAGPPEPKRSPGRPKGSTNKPAEPAAAPAVATVVQLSGVADEMAALERRLAEIRASRAAPPAAPTIETKPVGFIQGGSHVTAAFGVVNDPPAAPADLEAALDRAFKLPV